MTSSDQGRPGTAVPYILAGCTAVSILSTDLVTPSVPDLPEALGTDINTAQMVVSINLIAYALAQLVHGPLADTIGRRQLLMTALCIFGAVSIGCAFTTSAEQLLTGRFLQGLFSSVPSVVIVLMIRELYRPEEAMRVMTLYGATLGLGPALGPLMGGYLHVWFGWQAGFVFVAFLALLAACAVWKRVPESLDEPKPLRVGKAISDYVGLLGNLPFMRCTLATALCFAAFFAYITTAPVVFIDILGLEPQEYGLTNILIVSAYVLGNVAAAKLRGRFDPASLLVWSIAGGSIAMLLLLMGVSSYGPSIAMILAPMSLYAFCLAFILAAGPLVVLNQARDNPQGPAAALLGSLQLAASAGAGYASALVFDGTAMTMVVVMTVCVSLGGLFMFWQLARGPVAAQG